MGVWETVTSWVADDSMAMQAKSGVSASVAVYDMLDSRMITAPKNSLVAYEQAIYFTSIGIRRALREGNTATSDYLLSYLYDLEDQAGEVYRGASLFCKTTGTACPPGGSSIILQQTIDEIESSGLGSDDVVQITSILRASRRVVIFRTALPFVLVAGVAAAAGTWWYRNSTE